MPELPEVETMRRAIQSIAGGRIVDVERVFGPHKPIAIVPRIDAFRRRARGQIVEQVARRGKRVILELDRGDRIVIHPRMSGLVLLSDPPDLGHLRLLIRLDGVECFGSAEVLFWDSRGLGTVDLMSQVEFDEAFGENAMGPDALEITKANFIRRLAPGRREIKVALLDQRGAAGIGNIYASEMLHTAGIHPRRICSSLDVREWMKLHSSMRRVLNRAILHCGSTLRDGLYRVSRDREGAFQNYFRVYDRAGERCRTCRRGEIHRIVQSQRSTFYCPKCQV